MSRAELLHVDIITSHVDIIDFHLSIDGFFVNHNLTTRKDGESCSSRKGGCSNGICVINGHSSALCLCSDGMVLINGQCSVSNAAGPLLVYSRLSPEWIHGVRVAPDGITVSSAMPSILSLKGEALFTIDSVKGEIFFYDDAKSAIYKRSLYGGNVTLVIGNGMPPITETKNRIFKMQILKMIFVNTKVKGQKKTSNFFRLMFYSSTTQLRQHSIIRANLDGTNPTILVSFFSFHPLTMALDVTALKVYWLDPFEFTLHRAGYDGEDMNPSSESEKCGEKTQFMCKHTEQCIDINKVCDGRWDCYDGSDEDIRGICGEYRNKSSDPKSEVEE
ncbi:unnamed protein product [Haemonchus placei]|uniref:EGF-like domain-containing protein n=1 Tax=Haemonchus placei TaxID=6290 RepID=A0A0N4VT73_HAEPC|nr:unnamed protein product [Haemonchus placei]